MFEHKRYIEACELAEVIENLDIRVAGQSARWYDAKHSVLREIAQTPDANVLDGRQLQEVFEVCKGSIYICSVCGRIVFPEIEFQDGKVNITTEKCEVRGGKGNPILKENVCKLCKDRLNKIRLTKEQIKE